MQVFKELGITKESSIKDIERAFKKLSLIYHPDKNPENADKYKNIVRIRDILINPLEKETEDQDSEGNENCPQIQTQIKIHSERFRKIFDAEVCNFVPYRQNFPTLYQRCEKNIKLYKDPLYFQIFLDSIISENDSKDQNKDRDQNNNQDWEKMIQGLPDRKSKIAKLGQLIRDQETETGTQAQTQTQTQTQTIESKYPMMLMLCELLSEYKSIPHNQIIINCLEIINMTDSPLYHKTIVDIDQMIYQALNQKLYNESMSGYLQLLFSARIKLLEQFVTDKESLDAPAHYRFKILICQAVIALRQNLVPETVNHLRNALFIHHTEEGYQTLIDLYLEHIELFDSVHRQVEIDIDQFKYQLSHHQRFKGMKRYETHVRSKNNNEDANTNELEIIWKYIDMIDGVQGLDAVKQSMVCAAHLMIKYGESNPSLQYKNGAFCVVKELLQSLGVLCVKYNHLSSSVTTNHQIKWLYESLYKMSMPLFVENSPIPGFDTLDLVIYMGSIRSLDQYKSVTPIHGPMVHTVHDTVYESTILNELTVRLLKFYSDQESDQVTGHWMNPVDARYHLMQGIWDGWYQPEEENSFDKYKFDLMAKLLAEKKWDIERIEEIMSWSHVPRDSEGWMVPGPLVFHDPEIYSHIHGFTYNYQTGALDLILEVHDKNQMSHQPLFTKTEIDQILGLGVSCSAFTLDQPDTKYDKHPCQLAKCSPRSIQGTELWGTMLFADLFMKFCSMGMETSAQAPFMTRKIDLGFASVFSETVRNDLRMDRTRINNEVHRFWFAVDHVDYDEVLEGSTVRYMFGVNPQMVINTHRMEKNQNGEYVDTDDKKESGALGTQEEIDDLNKHTPEQKFAQNFTKHYDEIASHYPVFNKLKELAKIQAIVKILRGIAQNLETEIENGRKEKFLNMLRSKNIKLDTENESLSQWTDGECSWVPAVFYNMENESRRAYGGGFMDSILIKSKVDDVVYNAVSSAHGHCG
jgi:curved DNA-binding protein CbpA